MAGAAKVAEPAITAVPRSDDDLSGVGRWMGCFRFLAWLVPLSVARRRWLGHIIRQVCRRTPQLPLNLKRACASSLWPKISQWTPRRQLGDQGYIADRAGAGLNNYMELSRDLAAQHRQDVYAIVKASNVMDRFRLTESKPVNRWSAKSAKLEPDA